MYLLVVEALIRLINCGRIADWLGTLDEQIHLLWKSSIHWVPTLFSRLVKAWHAAFL